MIYFRKLVQNCLGYIQFGYKLFLKLLLSSTLKFFKVGDTNSNKKMVLIIELLIIADTDIDWVDLADDIRHEYFVVDNLRPSHGYKFRVLARNKFGWSIPSIPSPIVMTPSTGASKAEFYDALQALQVLLRFYSTFYIE